MRAGGIGEGESGEVQGAKKMKGDWGDVSIGDHHFFLWTPSVVMMMRVAATHQVTAMCPAKGFASLMSLSPQND